MSKWSTDFDRLLYSLVQKNKNSTWSSIAKRFTLASGSPVTADMVRNRFRRIQYEYEATDRIGLPNPLIDPQQKADYAGFKMAFFDIETTDLKAFMGRVLGASIADEFGNVTHRTYADFNGRSILDDTPLVGWLRDELDKYDILVSWNGKLFDTPFVNARLIRGLELPTRMDKMHIDLMYYAKGSLMRVGSAKLANVAKFLNVKHQKTDISWEVWQRAAVGDQEALTEVMDHCDADVLTLRDVFVRMKPLIKNIHR